MHSALSRGQNVFGYFTTVAFSLACLIALTSFISPQKPAAKLALKNVQVVRGRPHYYSSKKEEYAHIKFDLDADLSSLFNWNTKQVFVYITATFPPDKAKPNDPPSQAIIWDAILASPSEPWHENQFVHPRPKSSSSSSRKTRAAVESQPEAPGILKLPNQRPKYQVTDRTGKIAERANATLELGWNVQPWVGALTWTNWADWGVWQGLEGGRSETFDFPGLKGKKEGEDLSTAKGGEKNKGKPA